jgi:membrane protease YdiL (CAAX protease family)
MSVDVSQTAEAKAPEPPVAFTGKGTLLVGVLVGLLAFHVQLFVALCFLVFQHASGGERLSMLLSKLDAQGLGVSVSLLAGALVTTALVWMCVSLRTPEPAEYLGLVRLNPWVLFVSLAAMVAFAMGMDYGVDRLGWNSSSKVMVDTYQAAHFKPLFWIALIVGAPIYEEIFMRGFLFAGWRKSLGTGGAILVISLIWTFMHVQYGPVQWTMIFLMGILLGYARAWTGSLYAPIAMHALNNTMATVQLMREAGMH